MANVDRLMNGVSHNRHKLVEDVLRSFWCELAVGRLGHEGLQGEVVIQALLDQIKMAGCANAFVHLNKVGMRGQLSKNGGLSQKACSDELMVRI